MSVYKGDSLPLLRESLGSLYEQTIKADIHIWIDGQINENIKNFLYSEFKKGNIKFIGENKKNLGLAYSLNSLLKLAVDKYKYIARMDADDISMPYRIEKQFNFMEAHPDIDVVGGYIEEFSDDGEYIKKVTYPLTHDEMYCFFKKRVPLAHVTAFYRRTFFEKAGFYPTKSLRNEDTLMWMKGFEDGCRFANIPEVLVRVRVSPSFFDRRGGIKKAWRDFRDRIEVIRTLGYNFDAYLYALALFLVNISPGSVKRYLYKRLR
ncbi:glycosyltransferase [Nitratifractor salsuginis]|nr:glycosyltransferase [Nitratifractor salsuginis]